MLGGLFSAGWTIDELMDLTWDQIQLVAESVLLHKIWMFNMVAEPVSEALGSSFKGGRLSKPSFKSRKRAKSKLTNEQKDAMMMHNINAMGLPITTKK